MSPGGQSLTPSRQASETDSFSTGRIGGQPRKTLLSSSRVTSSAVPLSERVARSSRRSDPALTRAPGATERCVSTHLVGVVAPATDDAGAHRSGDARQVAGPFVRSA
jgi:hypothetical protein